MQFNSAGNHFTLPLLIILLNIASQCLTLEVPVPTLSANYIYYNTKHQNHRYDDLDLSSTTSHHVQSVKNIRFPQYVRKGSQSTISVPLPSTKIGDPEKVQENAANKTTKLEVPLKTSQEFELDIPSFQKMPVERRDDGYDSNISPLRDKTTELQQKIMENLQSDGYLKSGSPGRTPDIGVSQKVPYTVMAQLPPLAKYSDLQRKNLENIGSSNKNGGSHYVGRTIPKLPTPAVKTSEFRSSVPQKSENISRKNKQSPELIKSSKNEDLKEFRPMPESSEFHGRSLNFSGTKEKTSAAENGDLKPIVQFTPMPESSEFSGRSLKISGTTQRSFTVKNKIGDLESFHFTPMPESSEFQGRSLNIIPTTESILKIDTAQKRTGLSSYKKIRAAKWKYVCCIVLRWFKKSNDFPKVRKMCRRFKCYADTQVHEVKPAVENIWHEPPKYYTEWGHQDDQENHVEVDLTNNPKVKTGIREHNNTLGFSFVIVLSMIYIFAGVFVFLGLLSGSKDHKHIKIVTHPTNPKETAQELIQHIHIHLKGKQDKKKSAEELHGSQSEEEEEEADKIQSQNSRPSNRRRTTYKLNKTTKQPKTKSKSTLNLPIPPKNTQSRTSLEAKELTKEILGLTAEGMHTAAYSLLLVNVLGEILEDVLHVGGGGEGIPPGGEILIGSRNITLAKNHTLSKNTINLLADKEISKTLLNIATRYAVEKARNQTVTVNGKPGVQVMEINAGNLSGKEEDIPVLSEKQVYEQKLPQTTEKMTTPYQSVKHNTKSNQKQNKLKPETSTTKIVIQTASQEFATGFADQTELHALPGNALKFLQNQGVKHRIQGFTTKFTTNPQELHQFPTDTTKPIDRIAGIITKFQTTTPTNSENSQILTAFTTNAAIPQKNQNVQQKSKVNTRPTANQVWRNKLIGFTTKFSENESNKLTQKQTNKFDINPETTTQKIHHSPASIEKINQKASAGIPMVGYERQINYFRATESKIPLSSETLNRRASEGIPLIGVWSV